MIEEEKGMEGEEEFKEEQIGGGTGSRKKMSKLLNIKEIK
jgi:hypothetical protein